jgi:phosphonate transport system permease protein
LHLSDIEAIYAARRRRTILSLVALTATAAVSFTASEMNVVHLLEGLPGAGRYIAGTLPDIRVNHAAADLAAWLWGLPRWLSQLWDTVLIAFVGTCLAGAAGLMLSFFAASNLSPRWLVLLTRRVLEGARTVPDMVFALLFVVAFGLGPMAGVLALAIHGAGVLGKLGAELHENATPGPIDAIRATGGGWVATIRYGVVPQILAGFCSYLLLRFEINVRTSSVIGFIGVGGIGHELYLSIRQFVYQDVSAIALLIILTVMAIDTASGALRRRLQS